MRPCRVSHLALAGMVAQMVQGTVTVPDMAEATGLSEQTIRGYVRALRKARVLHIAAWEQDAAGRQTMPAYTLGARPDAKRKPPRTRAEIARHYRARKKTGALLGVFA